MLSFETKDFGPVGYEPEATIEFACGLPGFEDRRRFLALEFAASKPLVFLQSLEEPGLCFITAPVLAVDPEYVLRVSPEDLCDLGFSSARQPRIGTDVLCLAVLSPQENGTTANLLAPIVVNIGTLKAVQAIAPDSGYSHQFPLVAEKVAEELAEEAAVCS
jgi:flagellar assembly factor FliW